MNVLSQITNVAMAVIDLERIEKETLISGLLRWNDFNFVIGAVHQYNVSADLLLSLSSLSFLSNGLATTTIRSVLIFSVLLVTVISIWQYIKAQSSENVGHETREVFKRTIYTTFLIVLFPMIFAIADNISYGISQDVMRMKITNGDQVLGNGYEEMLGFYKAEMLFTEPLFYDFDPDVPQEEKDAEGNITKPFNINELCERETEQGCHAPTSWLNLGIGETKYYRYAMDANTLGAILGLMTFCNYFIMIQLVVRAFKISLLYFAQPIGLALGLVDSVEHISKNVSHQLYAGVFQVGVQLFTMKIVTMMIFFVFPSIFPNFGGFITLMAYLVGYFIILGVPKFVKSILKDGMNVMPKIRLPRM